jgi:hypothetical protein
MPESPLKAALKSFEATEANLGKLEKLWDEISALVPRGIVFGPHPKYEDLVRSYKHILDSLPRIDGWKPESLPMDLNDVAQSRLDALELGEPPAEIAVENWIESPADDLREYRFQFNKKRRALIRDQLIRLIDTIDGNVRQIHKENEGKELSEKVNGSIWLSLRKNVDEIDALLGSSVDRPPRWRDMLRHLHFGMVGDCRDIETHDWPAVKAGLRDSLYGAHEPLPVDIEDLAYVVDAKPRGRVTTKLNWSKLSPEGFERLVFALISNEQGYENPEWLMHTNAPDRGRDLSVTRVSIDPLLGTHRDRVVIQCRHRIKSSVSVADVATLRENMKAWGEPRVDILIVATSGRFSADAVSAIEKQNSSGDALRIEMWPESHLERILAARPALIAEFALR